MTSDFCVPFKSSEKKSTASCRNTLKAASLAVHNHAQRVDVVAKCVKDRLVGWPYKTAPHVLETQTRGLHIDADGKG